MYLLDGTINPCLEPPDLFKCADSDGGDEVAILPGRRAILHGAEFSPVTGTGEHGREDAHDQRQPGALVAADGQ